MKIFHEAPLCVFDEVQEVTDGDYFLVHLFEENPVYLAKARESVSKGRYTILDNSIFELGKSFDSERFLYWVNELQPTEYIIPDVLEDSAATIGRLMEWKSLYEPRVKGSSRSIGVVQGEDYEDVVWCYNALKDRVDKIAFSFDYAFLCPHAEEYTAPTRHEIFMRGRQRLLKRLLEDEIIDTSKPHHALGCFLPQEFIAYRNYEWLESLDTSSPVVAGINGVLYGDDIEGLREKDTTKIIEWMDKPLSDTQRMCIRYNIQEFRRMVCGG